eukprot:CAMPEP_0174923602 /NCGR_PEP_ID=MMETSP1355-20121228/6699_1 /TAXON_ID=464990 /ORGANISM="Hemiselmis tepida, Strain CCMP443" /LENGTH=42 /DNA_ID= /DNA_START= /DNA_END= /DNA_ORIENTATION=
MAMGESAEGGYAEEGSGERRAVRSLRGARVATALAAAMLGVT